MASNSVRWHAPEKTSFSATLVLVISAVAIAIAIYSFFRSTGPAHAVRASGSASALAPLSAWKMHTFESKSQNQHFDGLVKPGQIFHIPAGSPFEVRTDPSEAVGAFVDPSADATWDHEGGELDPAKDGAQSCRSPMQPGLYRLLWRPTDSATGPEQPLEVLVLSKSETHVQGDKITVKVNGKSIGAFHDPEKSTVRRVRENASRYRIPEYFATLAPQTIPLKLGPDFDLGDLIAFKDYKGADGKKVFTTTRHADILPIRTDLIDKLIKLRERLLAKGVKVTRFWITSGFRTPDYNRSIGGAAFSRHCYGDAVDLCIDEDNDKHMDDLNGDGKLDRKDGILIGNAVRELEAEGAVIPGGIGVYEWDSEDSVRSHVHIDCRGYISRWGQDGSGKYKKSFIWWPKAEFSEDDGE